MCSLHLCSLALLLELLHISHLVVMMLLCMNAMFSACSMSGEGPEGAISGMVVDGAVAPTEKFHPLSASRSH